MLDGLRTYVVLSAHQAAPVDAGAVEADEDAQIDGRPCRAPRLAIGTPSVVILLEQQRKDALLLLILRLADGVLAVAHDDAVAASTAPSRAAVTLCPQFLPHEDFGSNLDRCPSDVQTAAGSRLIRACRQICAVQRQR